jgi:hypothetical protein
MDKQSFNEQLAPRLIGQLRQKTEQGKLSWSTGFEDGQFKTLVGGRLAFVVQVKGDIRKFLVLDEHQEIILDEEVSSDETVNAPMLSPKDIIYDAIGSLHTLVRDRALQVNEKLATAEKLLADI